MCMLPIDNTRIVAFRRLDREYPACQAHDFLSHAGGVWAARRYLQAHGLDALVRGTSPLSLNALAMVYAKTRTRWDFDRLLAGAFRIIVACLQQYTRLSADRDDAFQVAARSLDIAARHYDAFKASFVPYFYIHLHGALKHLLRTKHLVPDSHGFPSSEDELAVSTGACQLAWSSARDQAVARVVDLRGVDMGEEVLDLVSEDAASVEDEVRLGELAKLFTRLLTTDNEVLTEQERLVLQYRFGIGGVPEMSQVAVADMFSLRGWQVSNVWIHHLQKRALAKLRAYLASLGED